MAKKPRPPILDADDRKRREVTEAERALWEEVVMQDSPFLLPENPTSITAPEEQADITDAPLPSEEQFTALLEAGLGRADGSSAKPPASLLPAGGVDWKTARRLRQGKMQPEAVLDLHGSTQAVAYEQLKAFLFYQQQRGRRCVLVITGKGRPRAGRQAGESGILRESLPDWLKTPPCSGMVQAFTKAHPKDGGDGAFYLLLRRGKT